MNETPLFTESIEEAKSKGNIQAWKDSFQANIQCKLAIENEIRLSFDGMYLDPGCAERVVEQFGIDRVRYVLAATLQEKDYDGRFSRSNKAWGWQAEIPVDSRNYQFVVDSHPAVLDGFISQFRDLQPELREVVTMC